MWKYLVQIWISSTPHITEPQLNAHLSQNMKKWKYNGIRKSVVSKLKTPCISAPTDSTPLICTDNAPVIPVTFSYRLKQWAVVEILWNTGTVYQSQWYSIWGCSVNTLVTYLRRKPMDCRVSDYLSYLFQT